MKLECKNHKAIEGRRYEAGRLKVAVTKLVLVLIIVIGLILSACSRTKPEREEPDANWTFDITTFIFGSSGTVPIDAKEFSYDSRDANKRFPENLIVDINYRGDETKATKLTNFIDKSKTDVFVNDSNLESRRLFTYHIVSSDGFSPRRSGLRDLLWEEFSEGYLVPSASRRSFFERFDVPNSRGYFVNFVQTIEMFRTITVVKPDSAEVIVQIHTLEVADATNNVGEDEPAIKLKDFISENITETPQNYKYKIVALNDNEFEFAWSDMENGFFFVGQDRTFVPGRPGQFRVWNPIKIRLEAIEE